MQLHRALIAGAFLFASFSASADPISVMHSNVRGLGMGDAYSALADDSSALFYNPAGLARVRGLNLKFFSLRAGVSGQDAYDKIKDIQENDGGDEFSELISELYGEHVWSGLGGEVAFTAPMIGIAVFNHADALIKVDNPVFPEIYTNVVNDYGYALGFGVPLSPFLHVGTAFKYIKRSGARMPFGASLIADLDPDKIYDNLTAWGKGYGVDAGINLVVPAPFFSATLSAVWRNMGGISFRSDNPYSSVPDEPNDVTVGAALLFDTPLLSVAPAVDFRYLNDPDIPLMRKLNFGVEVGLPLLDIRGGFHEGYYTAGFGVNLGLFRVDAATYGVELGANPGQIEDRRYVVEFTMELGVGGFSAPGVGGSSSSSSGGKSSSKSIWGGSRRLKQRR